MQHLGTLTGTGAVRLGDEPIGTVHYTIRVYLVRHLPDGRGTIEADGGVLDRIMNAGTAATIELEDGGTVDVLISNWAALTELAEVRTAGSIPGF